MNNSEEKKDKTKLSQTNVSHDENYDRSVTINDLIQIIRKKFILLLGTVLLTTFLAGLAAYTMPKIYRSKCLLFSPSPENVQIANILNSYSITANDLLREMYRNLKNEQLRLQLFNQINKDDEIKNKIKKEGNIARELHAGTKVVLSYDRKSDQMQVKVLLEGKYPQIISTWLNNYIKMVEQHTVQSFKEAFKNIVKRDIEDLKRRITTMQRFEHIRKSDKIARLEEAARIAEKIGLEEPLKHLNFVSVINSVERNNKLEATMTVNQGINDDYIHGTDALIAQIEILKKQKNIGYHSDELRDLEEEVFLLEEYDFKNWDFHAANISFDAQGKKKPIRPKMAIFILIGFATGTMISLFIVLINKAIEK